uniref:hypothetical protein n=1 Tax=Nocardia abscessus TaxID=120957 RepID=UPI002458E9FA
WPPPPPQPPPPPPPPPPRARPAGVHPPPPARVQNLGEDWGYGRVTSVAWRLRSVPSPASYWDG